VNAQRFTGKAAVYAKSRPSYPDAFLRYLYDERGFHADSAIADIGSGTGKLTQLLLECGSTVYGVEPNDDMRGAAEELLAVYPRFTSIGALAESTTLACASIDRITVAQAFHWFDRDAFRAECRRILRGGGLVTLVWNVRDPDSAVVQACDGVNKKFCTAYGGFTGGVDVCDTERFRLFFKEGQFETRRFDNAPLYDLDGFVGRSLSSSYAPRPEDVLYTPYVECLKDIFHEYSRDGVLVLPSFTASFTGTV